MKYNVLTSLQAEMLNYLFDSGIGEKGFYFTAGTALNEYYLPFRYSDDLDFFKNSDAFKDEIEWIIRILNEKNYNIEIINKPRHKNLWVNFGSGKSPSL